MSERKVLTKYYPPDFDPREISRKRGSKQAGPKIQAVRLMAPFSMRCLTCGEYIYKGRKFNSQKITPLNERYLGIQVHYFAIRCTRCSAEIMFATDPKNTDYAMVKGAKRNTEPWRNREAEQETVEERLDRLEREEAEAAGEEERNPMANLEVKNADARREMAAADALDEIRQRNARIQRSEKEGVDFADYVVRPEDLERERIEREDEEAAKNAFATAKQRALQDMLGEEMIEDDDDTLSSTATISSVTWSSSSTTGPHREAQTATSLSNSETASGGSREAPPSRSTAAVTAMPPPPPPAVPFKRAPKKKVDYAAKLGIKKKTPLV